MSRVHEALKRAKEEKAQQNVVETRISVPDAASKNGPEALMRAVHEEVLVTAGGKEKQEPLTRGKMHQSGAAPFLRFDDLLAQCAEPVWQPDQNAIVFSGTYAPSQGAEQFRTLRTRLYQVRDASPLKKVLVTSAVAGEGKTFVVTNLAQAIACEKERRILLIDGDLRSSRLHLPLGAPMSPGLAEYLRGEASEREIIQHGQEGNLCLIAGGHGGQSNATELLSNGRMQRLLDGVAPLFDWVIIDSPPCLPVSDSSVLAGFVDGLLLVVNAKSTPSAAVQKARQELKKRNVMGVVLNAVEESHGYGGYYGYGQGQGYGYSYGQESKNKKKNFLL